MRRSRKKSFWIVWILIILGSLSINFSIPAILEKYNYEDPFVVGMSANPPSIDPLRGYDSESQKVIMQVCEGLYRYNFSSSECEPIPCLAKEMAIRSGNNLTFTLHENVTFHDGAKFNASAVKWIFDRIQFFTSGLFAEDGSLIGKSMHTLDAHGLFIVNDIPFLNSTIIESEYVVTLVFNYGCGIWESLLANSLTAIHLPDENYQRGRKFSYFLEIDDPLIGTGSFKLIKYDYDNQIVFEYFEEYRLPKPENYIKNMIYLIVPDTVTRSLAILNYQIHWGQVYYDYDEWWDPNLVEIRIRSLVVIYIQMNMENMPLEVRKASAFAYNYTYLVEDRAGGNILYLHTPIPDGMQYHLDHYPGEPYLNLTLARELILSCPELTANISASGLTLSNTTEEWHEVAEGSNPLAWYNFTGYEGLHVNHYLQLSENMKAIGIRIDMNPLMPWEDYYDLYLNNESGNNRLTYSFGGRTPEYNDPINMIEPLFHSNGSANCFLLSDPILDDLIEDGFNETGSARRDAFYTMQEYLATDLMPSFYIYQRISSIGFNQLYLNGSTIQDLLNSFEYYYWANVEFHAPLDRYQRYGIHYIISLITFSGVMTIVGLSLITRNIVLDRKEQMGSKKARRQYFCPECGNVFKGPNYCRICGYKMDMKRLQEM